MKELKKVASMLGTMLTKGDFMAEADAVSVRVIGLFIKTFSRMEMGN